MDLQEVLCMAAEDAPSSYAANSNLQGVAIAKAKPVVQHSVEELCSTMLPEAPLVVADLGCSVGPNAFAVISEIMDAVGESCRKLHRRPPSEVLFFLNDLPANDFNSIFRSLSSYCKKVEKEKEEEFAGMFYVAGVPGSFYRRLFPRRSVHLFHSSSSIHWLSQVPRGLKDEHNNELNKDNIYVGRTSPPCVHKAYLQQFQMDFSTFLRCRSEEIQDGGIIVLTISVRSSSDPHSGTSVLLCELMTEALKSMANEGVIEEEDIDAFNVPFYNPSVEEVRALIDDEGEFVVVRESFVESSWDGCVDCEAAASGKLPSGKTRGQSAARIVRAAKETLFAYHFGEENNIVDEMFTRLARILTREFEKGEPFICPFYVVTLKKK